MNSILFALWFFLPAGIANASPIIASKLPLLRKWTTPLDAGKHYRGKRVFGANKTWRGLLVGAAIAMVVVYAQQLMWQNGSVNMLNDNSMEYLTYSPILLGFLFGFGALAGDAIESFFKRQHGVDAGKSWFPFDQTDYIIGGCVAVALVARLTIIEYGLILVVWFGAHLFFSYVGYLLKLKSAPI